MKHLNKARIGLATVVLMAVLSVSAMGFVGIKGTQYCYLLVSGGDTGYAYWQDYYSGNYAWHGPYTSDFWVSTNDIVYYHWYGVWSYNASGGYYYDVWFSGAF